MVDMVEMLVETIEHFIVTPVANFPFQFIEGEMNDIVVVKFAARQLIAQLQPHFV